MTYSLVAGIRFTKVGKLYHFDSSKFPDINIGDSVIVETSRGWQIGQVAQLLKDFNIEGDQVLKPIDRLATPRDLVFRQQWESREQDVVTFAKKRTKELGLVGVKVVFAEYSFDGSRLTIFFSAENEEKVELKSLRQDMQKAYSSSQVELRQIGPRDVAKMMCGMGACGFDMRCCSQFLCDFSSISIRMAKEQGISLTPTEITGMCGRLRCCLIYEYETYAEARKMLPKRNKRVLTPAGEGKVVDIHPLNQTVIVQLSNDAHRVFERSEIQIIEEENPPSKSSKEDQKSKGD